MKRGNEGSVWQWMGRGGGVGSGGEWLLTLKIFPLPFWLNFLVYNSWGGFRKEAHGRYVSVRASDHYLGCRSGVEEERDED